MTARRYPPGPGRLAAIRLARTFRNGSIDELEGLHARYGPIVYLPAPIDAYVLFAPEHVAHVLQTHHRGYTKSKNYRELAFVLGRGLVTSEGERWVAQRRRVGPAFRPEALGRHAAGVAAIVSRWSNELSARHGDGRPFDLTGDVGPLACAFSCSFLFGAAPGEPSRDLREWIQVTSDAALARIYSPIRIPRWVPTRTNAAERRALEALDAFVSARFAEARRSSTDTPRSALAELLEAGHGSGDLDDRELRDHMVTFLVAGQDTMEAALSWFFYLVAENPDAQHRIRQEVDELVGSSSLDQVDLESLRFTRACLLESQRLYPPIPIFARSPVEADELGGFEIPASSIVLCAVRTIHRSAKTWSDPLEFRPERFLSEGAVPEGAFLAFGSGPRRCIGERLAMQELTAAAAGLLRSNELRLEPGFAPVTHTTVAMKPRGGVRVSLRACP